MQLRTKTPWPLVGLIALSSLLSLLAGFYSAQLSAIPSSSSSSAITESSSSWTVVQTVAERSKTEKSKVEDEDDDEEGARLAQLLMVEMDDVVTGQLTTPDSLGDAIQAVAKGCELDLMRFHCWQQSASGVISCLGLLKNGHIFLNSWTMTNEVLVDVFQTIMGDEDEDDETFSMKPLVEHIKRALEKYRSPSSAYDTALWGISHRGGFLTHFIDVDYENSRVDTIREEIASVQSDFQKIEIIDFRYPPEQFTLVKALQNDPDYVADHPDLFLPDRALFMDGILQSRRSGNAAYHEALVHPAMFAHPNPRRVAVIGGGEYATLREILKHNTVERAVMIDIDQMIMDVSQEHLPDWNDCSDLLGSSRHCKDDPRAEVYAEDAFKWFNDRYLEPKDGELPFDVIIMDALDPQNVVEFAGALYGDGKFLKSLYNALSENGILISQVGIAPNLFDPSEQASMSANREVFIDSLIKLGFQSILDYEEARCGFGDPWGFRVAFKDNSLKANWRANTAEIEYEIQKRSVRTRSGRSPFLYFDGATMQTYHYPTKASEVVFCRNIPMPEDCKYGRQPYPDVPNIPIESFEVKQSTVGENAGRGVFALVDIPEESYISLRSSATNVHMQPKTHEIASDLMEHKIASYYGGALLWGYFFGYGCVSADRLGAPEVHVDPDLLTFVNHGCNGTSNVGMPTNFTEFTVDTSRAPDDFRGSEAHKQYVYNPLYERDTSSHSAMTNHRRIGKGDEVLDNYLAFSDIGRGWKSDIEQLRSECAGALGLVEHYQREEWDEL